MIVFAREPVAGRAKTRLAARIGDRAAASLADAFLRDTLAKATLLRCSLVIAADTPAGVKRSDYFQRIAARYRVDVVDQRGGNLGARMANALRPFAERGAILIGSDFPSLPRRHLRGALELLEHFEVVLGPALDGGYYLLGVRGKLPPIFRGIEWSSARVLGDTIAKLRAARVRYALAPSWYDVDDVAALALLTAHLSRRTRFGAALDAAFPLERNKPCPATTALLRHIDVWHRL